MLLINKCGYKQTNNTMNSGNWKLYLVGYDRGEILTVCLN